MFTLIFFGVILYLLGGFLTYIAFRLMDEADAKHFPVVFWGWPVWIFMTPFLFISEKGGLLAEKLVDRIRESYQKVRDTWNNEI